jgi:hypothetical protein
MSSESPLELWKRKLAFLQRAEALETDAAAKFKLEQDIEECKEKIREFENTQPPQPLSGNNPFYPPQGAINETSLLFNCENTLREIFELLNSQNNVALIGATGSGKSSILKAIEQQASNKLIKPRKPIYLDLSIIQNDHQYYQTMRDLMGLGADDSIFSRQVTQQGKKFLLLLDGSEQLTWNGFTRPMRSELRSLINEVDPLLNLVVTANKDLTQVFKDSDLDSPFEGICTKVPLPPWDGNIIRAFINSRLAGSRIRFSEAEIISLINRSGGNPRQLVRECFQLYRSYEKNV